MPLVHHRVTLLSRAGCHRCDEARGTLVDLCERTGASFEDLDVDADRETRAEYGDLVPVVLVDDVELCVLDVDAETVRAALSG